jgi:hypothetical protein
MSSKKITKEARRVATQGPPGAVPEAKPIDIIIYEFPSGRPQVTLKAPEVLDKSEALNKYTDKNSMLYTYHQMRRDEQKSILTLANWDEVLKEAQDLKEAQE